MTSTEAEIENLMRRVNNELYGEGNLDLIDDYVAENYVEYNSASPEPIRGRDGYRENVQMVRSAFPDMDVITEDLIVTDETAVNHWTITGTHEGAAMGIEPAGRHVEFSGISIGRFDDGKVVEGRTIVDMYGLMQQLGVIEPPSG